MKLVAHSTACRATNFMIVDGLDVLDHQWWLGWT
jgi:hypothetical protein